MIRIVGLVAAKEAVLCKSCFPFGWCESLFDDLLHDSQGLDDVGDMDFLLELLQSFGEYPLLSAQSEALAARFEAEFGKLKFEVEEGDAAADSLNFIFVLVSLRISSIELLLLIG